MPTQQVNQVQRAPTAPAPIPRPGLKPPAQPDWMKPVSSGSSGVGTQYLQQALAKPSDTSAQYSAASDANAAGYQAQVEALNRSGLSQQDPAYQARLRALDTNRLTSNSAAAAQAAAQAEQTKLGVARDLTGAESADASRRMQAELAAQAQMFGIDQQNRSQAFQNKTMDKQRGWQEADTASARAYQDAVMGKQRTWQESDAAQQMKHQLLMQQQGIEGQGRIAGAGYAAQERMLGKTQAFNRDVMNTQRGWQTADTLADRAYQDRIMNTQRGWQQEDYTNQSQDAIDRMALQALFGMM